MIKLYREYSEDSKSIFCDSDEFPNDVFTRYKCLFNLSKGTVSIFNTIYKPNGGTTYYLPFEAMDKSWIDRGGYRIQPLYYRDANPSNPSGSKENLWFNVYLKDYFAGTTKVTKILGAIKYEYDKDDNLTTYYRVQPLNVNSAYQQAVSGQKGANYTLYTQKYSL